MQVLLKGKFLYLRQFLHLFTLYSNVTVQSSMYVHYLCHFRCVLFHHVLLLSTFYKLDLCDKDCCMVYQPIQNMQCL